MKKGDRVKHTITGETGTVVQVGNDQVLVDVDEGSGTWVTNNPVKPVLWHVLTLTAIK
jgi:preprotein translocase subunit YajC